MYLKILVYPSSSCYIGVYRSLSNPKIMIVGVCRYLSYFIRVKILVYRDEIVVYHN